MDQSLFQLKQDKTVIRGVIIKTTLSKEKGVVVLVHGMGEHYGRYLKSVIPMLLDTGLTVVTYDNVGHGHSDGKRGHCPSYTALLAILEKVIEKAQTTFPSSPLFLYGHSMGGNLVLNYVLRRKPKISGVIATSPYLKLAFQPPLWKIIVGKLMFHIWPSITLPRGVNSNGISRIPEEVAVYTMDPLAHNKISPMFFYPVVEAGEWAIANANIVTTDILLMHGTGDTIIDSAGTEAFHKNAKNSSLQLFKGGYHELHNDLCKDEMLQHIKNWLTKRV